MDFHTGEALRRKAINENAESFHRFDARDCIPITAFATANLMVSARPLRFWRERLKAIRYAGDLELLKAGVAEIEVSCKA